MTSPVERRQARIDRYRASMQQHAPPPLAIVGPVPPSVLHYFHTGDLGDIIASLPVVRQIGNGHFVIGDVPMQRGLGRRESMEGARYESVKTLVEIQPYILSVEWQHHPKLVTHDFSTFRRNRNFHGSTIADWQGRHLGQPKVDYTPWLTVDPADTKGRVIVARSSRYHEPEFPWKAVVESIGDRALFIGLDHEQAAFEEYVGRKVERAVTPNLLEVARTIAGADLTIVNQTSTFWVAAGLGGQIIQVTCKRVVDSVVSRPNCRYPMSAFDYAELIKTF